MTIFYSGSKGGFYRSDIHGKNIPGDAVEIDAEDYAALLAGQSAGKCIVADASGKPVLADQPKATADAVRADRNARLTVCDYRMMPDYPQPAAARDEWTAYRQALREVPKQKGFPDNVKWPSFPG
jgi:hypothetical protein